MSVVGECFFWYRLTRVVPDNFHRAVKRLCVCVLKLNYREITFTYHCAKLRLKLGSNYNSAKQNLRHV